MKRPMNEKFPSLEAAFMALSNPQSPDWLAAFSFLASQPETAEVIMQTFSETLEQMGIEPSGTDPGTGEPAYGLADVGKAMGIPEDELEEAMNTVDK